MKRNYTPISRLLTASVMLFMVSALTLLGQTPGTFNYQAVLRDAGGDPRAGANVAIELEIHQATSTGTIVYSEMHNTTTNGFGLVNLEIGSVSPGTFATIDWSAGPYFVEVSVDATSMGTSELLTVPYALHASTAENYTETDPAYTSSPAASISAGDITNLGNLSGTNTGDQNISGIASNASAISAIQAEQTVQNSAIALNTAKVGLSPAQVTILGNTSGTNTGDEDGSETHVNAGANVSVTGTGTAGNPYVVNSIGNTNYGTSRTSAVTIASTSIGSSTVTEILQLTNVPAGTYAVFFSCPVRNQSTSSAGLSVIWALTNNDYSPSFPTDGITTSFVPASGWAANHNFGQSGFKVITLGSTGTIELKMAYYGSLSSGTVSTTGTVMLRAIRL